MGPGPGSMAPVASMAEPSPLSPQIIKRPPLSGLESQKISPVFNEFIFFAHNSKVFCTDLCFLRIVIQSVQQMFPDAGKDI